MPPRKSDPSSADSDTLTLKEQKKDSKLEEQNPDADYHLIIEKGVANKLSPKSSGKIYFQLARNQQDDCNYLRINSNDGGGLHSREWIALEKIVITLSGQIGHPFKSTALKECMVGKSSNNASFLAAILRAPEIGLIKASEKSAFHHQLVEDFEKRSSALLKRSK